MLESLQERQRAAQRRAAISSASGQTSAGSSGDSAAAAGPLQHSLPASSSTASAAGSSRRQGSLSDSELDVVAAGSLQSWFTRAPPSGPPKTLQPDILDHQDPHVVNAAIMELVERRQLDEAVKAVTHVVAKNRRAVLEL